MKIHPATALLILSMLSLLDVAIAEVPKPLPVPRGKRPKFTSKIHIPVQLAAEKAALPPEGYKLVFEDGFNGDKLDTWKQGFRLDRKLLSTQQQENVSVKDGNLVIAMRRESAGGKDYTGGGIISRERFVYGYYETRFKTPPAEGWHTAFWSMRKS